MHQHSNYMLVHFGRIRCSCLRGYEMRGCYVAALMHVCAQAISPAFLPGVSLSQSTPFAFDFKPVKLEITHCVCWHAHVLLIFILFIDLFFNLRLVTGKTGFAFRCLFSFFLFFNSPLCFQEEKPFLLNNCPFVTRQAWSHHYHHHHRHPQRCEHCHFYRYQCRHLFPEQISKAVE